jgi:hypothetical protein
MTKSFRAGWRDSTLVLATGGHHCIPEFRTSVLSIEPLFRGNSQAPKLCAVSQNSAARSAPLMHVDPGHTTSQGGAKKSMVPISHGDTPLVALPLCRALLNVELRVTPSPKILLIAAYKATAPLRHPPVSEPRTRSTD